MGDIIRKPLTWVIGVILLILAGWWLYSALTRDARTEARLGKNQAEAASEGGKEAVNTVGKAGEREAASEALTRTNSEEIRNAEGADAPVAGGVRDAGLDSLCKRRAYRGDPRCLSRVHP